ncbi:MAG: aminotransferase class I/II-fold pyridoxal phosphate-dependent enzyme [Tissierellia bacterium]|nr:aminotransferase class I/II-fold pyridoxal phosphate-dependent enzyme [Tissierellia bacterium]
MTYDFTSLIDRRGKDALALDGLGKNPGFAPDRPKEGFDPIPMWVADMNFATAPSVVQAMKDRLDHPLFGYFAPREDYYRAIQTWQGKRHGVLDLDQGAIGFENGVLGGVVSALGALASRGEGVLVHSPTYIGFTKVLKTNGYRIIHSPLIRDGEGVWRMDYEDMERQIKKYKIHVAIFCSPHNPTGRVWEEEEIKRAMDIYKRHQVFVISDEIWADLTLEGHRHIPTQSVSEDAKMRTVALYSPSKTFNLAGITGSYHLIYNPWLRDRVRREAALSHYNALHLLSMHALMGAYTQEGAQWLDQLRGVLTQNVQEAVAHIRTHWPQLDLASPQGTYMLFVDCGQWLAHHQTSLEALEKAAWEVGVMVQDGKMFQGPTHLRMNLALPNSQLREALDRLDRYVFNK